MAPEGYCALGCVAVVGYEKPGLDEVMCVHSSLCTPAGVVSEDPAGPLWKDAGSGMAHSVRFHFFISHWRGVVGTCCRGGQ